ncbi:MAG: hypothetical protein HDR22_02510 [Lachnospiraceae bacterium]|nr:hypothetical protein [Lachnospiraceae bacterium]
MWKILLCCNLLVLSPSIFTVALDVYAAVLSWEPFSILNFILTLLNGFYGIISIPAIIIIPLITIFIIIDEYKKENLAEKDLVILIVLCLLNILASLGSREFASMVMST